MKTTTSKKIILAGSILGTILLGSTLAANMTQDVTEIQATVRSTKAAANVKGIGAFSNLESFDNDGFNNGVKKATQNYYKNNTATAGSDNEARYKTSAYSDDGHEYVDLLKEHFANNDIIISAGFQVANAITGVAGEWDGLFTKADGTDTEFANSADKAFVLLDDTSLGAKYSNAASVSFAAEGAGFLSAMGAAVYTEYDAINSDKDASIVMWGGMPFPTVYDYMSGFAQGINWFNSEYAGTDVDFNGTSTELKEITLWNGGQKQGETVSDSNKYGGNQENSNGWFTFGFDAATGTTDGDAAKIKTDNAIATGSSIVFPIAGGNTTVAEKELLGSADSTTRLLGVDADATIATAADDLYIGSAQKNLIKGGELALWTMDDIDADGERNIVDSDDTVDTNKSTYEAELADWNVTTSEDKGVQLRGTIDNGGVGFLFGAATDAGMNPALEEALTAFGTDEDGLNGFLAAATAAQVDGINAADETFTNVEDAPASDSNIGMIILWVALALLIVGLIAGLVLFLVKKGKKEEEE